MEKYTLKVEGLSDLLMNHNNIAAQDALKTYLKVPSNKKKSVAGDDRFPANKWLTCLYAVDGHIGIPSDNWMTCIRDGGKLVPTGVKNQNYQRRSQSGILLDHYGSRLLVNGKLIPISALDPIRNETDDFDAHTRLAASLGFELFVKPANINGKRHKRVRPRFANWSTTVDITVIDDTLTEPILSLIFEQAGSFSGLCDWRPGAPRSPGPFGRFTSTLVKRK